MRHQLICLAAAYFADACCFADRPRLTAHPVAAAQRVNPIRLASFQQIDGHIALTSDWISYAPPETRGKWQWVWDSIDLTSPDPALGQLTDASPGCTASVPAGVRWALEGPDYNNPSVSNDIRFALPGARCDGMFLTWLWNVGGAGTSEQCFIAMSTFESWGGCSAPDPGSDPGVPLGGIIYDFGVLASSYDTPEGFYFTAIDLTGFGFWHKMPMDGFGGFQLRFGQAFDQGTGIITPPTLVQPLLWGTSDNEPVPDGRTGSQGADTFSDDNPADGVFGPNECYSLESGVCPDPLGAAVGFSIRTGELCPCTGDLAADGWIDLYDLTLLLSAFGFSGAGIPNPCLDLNNDQTIDLNDLAELLARFGDPC